MARFKTWQSFHVLNRLTWQSKIFQWQPCPEEFRMFAAGEKIHRGSPLLNLRPIFDRDDRVLRVTGRVDASFELLGVKPPILIPDHCVTKLLVKHFHLKLKHIGYKTIHAELLKSDWIVGGRPFVKRLTSSVAR